MQHTTVLRNSRPNRICRMQIKSGAIELLELLSKASEPAGNHENLESTFQECSLEFQQFVIGEAIVPMDMLSRQNSANEDPNDSFARRLCEEASRLQTTTESSPDMHFNVKAVHHSPVVKSHSERLLMSREDDRRVTQSGMPPSASESPGGHADDSAPFPPRATTRHVPPRRHATSLGELSLLPDAYGEWHSDKMDRTRDFESSFSPTTAASDRHETAVVSARKIQVKFVTHASVDIQYSMMRLPPSVLAAPSMTTEGTMERTFGGKVDAFLLRNAGSLNKVCCAVISPNHVSLKRGESLMNHHCRRS